MTDSQKRDQAVALHAKGRSYRSIAAELSVPKSTIQDWLQSSARRSMDEVMTVANARRDAVIKMRVEDGLSMRAIAREVEISPTQTKRILDAAGIDTETDR